MVTVFFGSREGRFSHDRASYWSQDRAGVPGDTESVDRFGWSLAAADFNGDYLDDLAIGIPGEDYERHFRGTLRDTGSILVLYGGRNDLSVNDASDWHQDRYSVQSSRDAGDRFGYALTAGHFNRDGIADLVVGVPGEDINTGRNQDQAGMLHIFYGTKAGLSSSPSLGREILTEGLDTEPSGSHAEADDQFGSVLP